MTVVDGAGGSDSESIITQSERIAPVRRLPTLLVLCVALIALVVGFGLQFNGSDAYPDPEAIDDEYPSHVGERVHLWGEVVETGDGTVVLAADPLRFAVSDPPPRAVDPGDSVQVYGTLRPDRRMETTAYDVQSTGRIGYMYGVSVLGALLAAAGFLRRWRVDRSGWRFVPREGE
ncbi:hypothetical protein DV707_03705 [Halobellus limi]|uniref:Uncharacterized protein n=1 Tax=Halobellus limi TaxID=699433 RepID=A0A1H5V3M2_9EURY|nr:hypothetical protein DV707_03705 [Halobellus limi]SEF81338.1 hypothetical protein SAMN04488133_0816 [Halobellus limi]